MLNSVNSVNNEKQKKLKIDCIKNIEKIDEITKDHIIISEFHGIVLEKIKIKDNRLNANEN